MSNVARKSPRTVAFLRCLNFRLRVIRIPTCRRVERYLYFHVSLKKGTSPVSFPRSNPTICWRFSQAKFEFSQLTDITPLFFLFLFSFSLFFPPQPDMAVGDNRCTIIGSMQSRGSIRSSSLSPFLLCRSVPFSSFLSRHKATSTVTRARP